MLQYVMSVSRFAHYIKVMGRDKVGGFTTAESLEREFQKWLFNYTMSSDDVSEEMCFRYPLNEARIKIKEKIRTSRTLLFGYSFKAAFSIGSNGINYSFGYRAFSEIKLIMSDSHMNNISNLLQQANLVGAIGYIANQLQEKPKDADLRSRFVELLCIDGQLERADKQLNVLVKQNPEYLVGATNVRQLIRLLKRD